MLDALPPNLAAELKALEARIKILEGSNKLLVSTIRGGSLQVQDDDGNLIVRIGRFPASGYDGFLVIRDDGIHAIVEANQTEGLVHPWLEMPWKTNTASQTVTSGTFTSVWQAHTELLYGVNIRMRVAVDCPSGTTGEMLIADDGSSTVLGSVKTIPSNSSVLYEYRVAHGLTVGSGPFQFSLQARRTSGAGNIIVYQPWPMHQGAGMSPVAGGWV